MFTFEALKDGYTSQLAVMTIRPEWEVRARREASVIEANKTRYQSVERITGVPWFVVGLIHMMEAACDFNLGLGQGDPWRKVSTHVPKGFGPFQSWEAAAVFYLHRDKTDQISDWTRELLCFRAESFNGFGYRGKNQSPYLWSGSNIYVKGKYTSDGHYDPEAVSEQVGVMVILKALEQNDDSISAALDPNPVPEPKAPHADDSAQDDTPANEDSPTLEPTAKSMRDDGSRHMTILDRLKKMIWGAIFGGVSLNFASQTSDLKDTADGIYALLTDHASLVLLGSAVCIIIAVELAEHYSVLAAKAGRYVTRGAVLDWINAAFGDGTQLPK